MVERRAYDAKAAGSNPVWSIPVVAQLVEHVIMSNDTRLPAIIIPF